MSELEQLTQRVDRLENILRALVPEVQRLREALGARVHESRAAPTVGASEQAAVEQHQAATSPPHGAPPHETPAPHAPLASASAARAVQPLAIPEAVAPPGLDLESLVGRYGSLALAVLTILLGVGAFVRWAASRGLLGPTMRVVLGLMAAVIVAGVGLWLRERGATRFAYVLLALALAIVHVDAWGAGPELHVVPSPAALAGAALASVALAWLALADDEPSIFSVGVGGAFLAPFVTSNGEGHLVALLAFGYIVLAASVWAVRDRQWLVPVLVLCAAALLYTVVGSELPQPDWSAPRAYLPAAFALSCALTGIVALPSGYGSGIGQSALAALWIALMTATGHGTSPSWVLVGAAVGSVAAFASVAALKHAPEQTVLGACLLPCGFLGVAVWVVPPIAETRAATIAMWAFGTAAASAIFGGPSRPQSYPTAGEQRTAAHRQAANIAAGIAGLEGALAIGVCWGPHSPRLAVALLAAYGALAGVIAARRLWSAVLVPTAIALMSAAIWSWLLLIARQPYDYTPFATPASLVAAVTCAAWVVACEFVARAPWIAPGSPTESSDSTAANLRAVRFAPVLLIFWWGRTELASMISVQVSTFALIVYYAAAGIAGVAVGRARRVASLRHAGLAVAVYAAIKAVAEASQLGIALRVSSYLCAGVFLLGVAYWYRDRQVQA